MARGDQERAELREKLLQQGRTRKQIAAAMARTFKDRPRTAWRHAYGWTQQEVADRYNSETKDSNASMTAHRISDFERWPVSETAAKPTVPTLGVLAKIFCTKISKLLDHHDRQNMSNAELITCAVLDSGITPQQLPATISQFVGRTHELDTLTAQLNQAEDSASTAMITAIDGTAGIGKTTLALHWARTHSDQFPDGQLYVDLRGFDPRGIPVTPQEAIRGFLDAFQIPADRIPIKIDDQAALYRTLVEDRRLLVVLDNARDVDQVWPLLPGSPSCLVLVTSRQQLGGLVARNRAVLITLDFMTTEEARQLLATIIEPERIQAEPDAVDELIRYCVGLPIALSIAAARINAEPHLPLSTLVGQLREQRQRLGALATGGSQFTDIRAVFSWSYTALSTRAARLFRLLGLHPGPDISTLAAASLVGLPEHDTHQLLIELTQAHLIKQHVPGRYQFHDLLRVYATEQANIEDSEPHQQAAQHRALDYYLHTAYSAALLIYPRAPIRLAPLTPGVTLGKLTDYRAALTWFETERSVLVAVVSLADNAGFTAHAWQLPWTFADAFYRRGYWQDYATTQYTALAAARRLGDSLGQAHAHHGIGDACTWLVRFDESYTHHQQSLTIFTELGDQVGQADAHVGLAWVFVQQCDYRQALGHAQQAIDSYRMGGYQIGQANALNLLGSCHSQLGDYQQALVSCQQALALHREVNDRHGEAGTLHNIGSAYYYLGHHAEAISYYQQALDLKRQFHDQYFEACTLTGLGNAYHAIGNHSGAREVWQQALNNFERLGHPDAEHVRTKLANLDAGPDESTTSDQL